MLGLVVLAGVAWACAWYVHRTILARRVENQTLLVAQEQMNREKAAAALLHATVNETAVMRERLDAYARTDVVSTASAIEAAGKAAGASARVIDVSQMSERDPALAGITNARSIGYTVDARGSFQQLMTLLQLLEVLPAPAAIDQFSLAKNNEPGAKAGSWRMNLRLRLITTEHDL